METLRPHAAPRRRRAPRRAASPGCVRTGVAGFLILLGAAAISAQAINPGGFGLGGEASGVSTLSFLKLPISARAISVGGRSLTTDEEATLVHGNPAALALVENYYYSLSHAEILGEFRHEDLALAFPYRTWGGFGVTADILAATAFADARNIDEEPVEPAAYDMALGLAWGQAFARGRLAAGARLDLIRSDIDGTTAQGYALNAGLLFFMVRDLRLSLSLHNLSHGIRYDDPGSPLEPLPLSVGVELGKPLLDTRWSAHAGLWQSNEGLLNFYGGGEWRILRFLMLRAGYEGSSQDRELGIVSGLSAGVGMQYERLTLDYGYKTLGLLGSYHAVTLNYSHKVKYRNLDEVLLERAKGQYRKGKYAKALALARKAVAANPYNFKAQALAKQLQLEMDRRDETAFTLCYTANTDGALASQWKDGRAYGGLARRKTKLMELKGAQGKILILDAGNLTLPGLKLNQETYVHGAYAQMPYDALNLGAGELHLGSEKRDGRLPWLASQKPLADGHLPLLREKTLALKRGAEVKVLGALDPASLRTGMPGGKELEGVAEAVRRQGGGARAGRILVLLLNGSLAGAARLAEKVPELDAIILSGEAQVLGSPMRVGKTLICSPGRGGMYVGELILTLDRGGAVLSHRHHLIPLDASVPEDPDLKKFLAPVTVDPNRPAMDAYDEDYRAQVIAFVNSPAPGAPGRIFLRDLLTGRDYPIPAPGLACSGPVLGYGKNKVAFLGRDSSGIQEVYAAEPGAAAPGSAGAPLRSGGLDTLSRLGGRALSLRWILGHNAVLALYAKAAAPGAAAAQEIYRIDPWSHEMRDLSGGRFGRVTGFDPARSGDRLALTSGSDSGSTLWVTAMDLATPLPVLKDTGRLASPRWNRQGNRLAFLAFPREAGKGPDSAAGELRVFDFEERRVIPATLQSRVRDFAWSADGGRIYYVAGVNLLDINEYVLDSLSLRKVKRGAAPEAGAPGAAAPRSEESPAPKIYRDRDGLIFEAVAEGAGKGRRILWRDLETGREEVLVDSAGANSLH